MRKTVPIVTRNSVCLQIRTVYPRDTNAIVGHMIKMKKHKDKREGKEESLPREIGY